MRPTALALLLGSTLLLSGCTQSPPPAKTAGAAPPTPPAPPGCEPVPISGHAWPTPTLTLKPGTCVEFTNHDFMDHRFMDAGGRLDSGEFLRNARLNHTFNQTGTYTLEILKHPGRTLHVTVE